MASVKRIKKNQAMFICEENILIICSYMDFETITNAYTAMKFIKELYMKRKKKVNTALLLDAVNFSKFNMYESCCNRNNYTYLPRVDATMYQCIIGNLSMVKFLMRNKKIYYHYDLPKADGDIDFEDPRNISMEINHDSIGFLIEESDLLTIACKHKHFHIMKYLLSIGYKFDEYYFFNDVFALERRLNMTSPLEGYFNGVDLYHRNNLELEKANFFIWLDQLIPLLPKIKQVKYLHRGKIRNDSLFGYLSGHIYYQIRDESTKRIGIKYLEKLCDLGHGTRAELKKIMMEIK